MLKLQARITDSLYSYMMKNSRKCGKCREYGHNVRTCPKVEKVEERYCEFEHEGTKCGKKTTIEYWSSDSNDEGFMKLCNTHYMLKIKEDATKNALQYAHKILIEMGRKVDDCGVVDGCKCMWCS